MMQGTQKHKSSSATVGGAKSYKEVITFLDNLRKIDYSKKALERIKQLDTHFSNISQDIDVILIGGTNGKSSTIHFTEKLLKEEGYKVGSCYSSNIINYNERISLNSQVIQNKSFTELLNNVISVVESKKIDATVHEIFIMASLIYFKKNDVDVAMFEVGIGGRLDATSIFNPKIAAITRIASDSEDILGEDLDQVTEDMLDIAKKGTWLVSAEQSKIRLNKMKELSEKKGIKWTMPIRKLASLPYMYEQLYGRNASLGERIAQIFTEEVKQKFSPFLRGNLLATQRGQRGRPTLEAKRNAELNPLKTLKRFWHDEFSLLPGRFELLDKEKPSLLLDNAENIDALENLFLGIRLLHYQKPLKDFVMIIGLPSCIEKIECIKLLRYLLKKVSGQALFVPLENCSYHEPKDLENIATELGAKSKACSSFSEAFEMAKKSVDEREGLAVITGHQNLISEYWKYRGIKKI